MDKDMHQGRAPEHVDLTQVEDEPGARVDPLFERQTEDAEITAPWFGARFSSDAPVRSPTGTATALLKVVLAAGLPAAGLAAGGWAMRVAGWLTLTLAVLIFLIVGMVGLLLIVHTTPTSREIDSADSAENSNPHLQNPCHETDKRQGRQAIERPAPARGHRALQPPRYR